MHTQRRKTHEYRLQPPLIQPAIYPSLHPHPGHIHALSVHDASFSFVSGCVVMSVVGEVHLPLPLQQAAYTPALADDGAAPPIFMTQTTVRHSQPDTYPSYTHPRALGASAPLASAMSWCLQRGSSLQLARPAHRLLHWNKATS